MIDRGHRLPLKRQAEILRLSRGSLDYHPCPVSAADLAIMRRIDELHLDHRFAGGRMLRDLLRGEDIAIGREGVASMMRGFGSKRSIAGRIRPNPQWGTRSIGICCVTWRLSDRTRCGR